MRLLTVCVVAITAAGCEKPAPASDQTVAPTVQGGYTPDSLRAEQLARFRQGVPEVTELMGGAATQEELVRTFLTAAQAGDAVTLDSLVLSRAEFAWVYYPTTPQALPPYDLDPDTFWLVTSERGGRGLAKVLETLRGTSFPYAGHRCEGEVSREGRNDVYGPCLVRLVQAPGDTVEARLFGLIIERDGRWKFVSYANRLD